MEADRFTHHNGDIELVRTDGVDHADHSPIQKGAVAWWADGSTSYLLHTRTGHVHGYTLADEMDTVIQFVDRLRLGEEITPDSMAKALEDIRRLRLRLDAVEGEAILVARESIEDNAGRIKRRRPRLTFEAIAGELGLDHSTVVERYKRMSRGIHAAWRHWLVQHTDRDAMYAGPKDES